MQAVLSSGGVDLVDGLGQTVEITPFTDGFGQWIGNVTTPTGNGRIHHRPHLTARQPFRQRVHRHNAAGTQRFHRQRLPLRRIKHQAAQILIHLPAENHLHARFQLINQPFLVKPGGLNRGRAIADDRLDNNLIGARAPGARLPNRADDRHLFTISQVFDRLHQRVIIIAARENIKQFPDCLGVQPLQLFGQLGANALDGRHRLGQSFRVWFGRRHRGYARLLRFLGRPRRRLPGRLAFAIMFWRWRRFWFRLRLAARRPLGRRGGPAQSFLTHFEADG